jgi:hypothetical protein
MSLQTQINKLEALVSIASQAMESENFAPSLRDYEFVVDTLVDCLDEIRSEIGNEEVDNG